MTRKYRHKHTQYAYHEQYTVKFHGSIIWQTNMYLVKLRLPVGRGGVINSPRSDFLGVFSVSQVGLPLMGDTAVHCCLSPSDRNF